MASVVYNESPSYQRTESPSIFPTLQLSRGSAKVTENEEAGSRVAREAEAAGKWEPCGSQAPPGTERPGTIQPLTPLKQEPSQLKAGGFLKGPATAPAKHKWDLRGRQARRGGAAGASEPRLGNVIKEGSPWEGPGGEDLERGGTPEVARGRGRLFPRLRIPTGLPATRQATPPNSSGGPRHHYWATPLPLPGSAAQPAPRTPSFWGLTNLSPWGEASPKRPRSRSLPRLK